MKAFLINLDRSPERLRFFEQQAEAAGLAFERTAAVDGKELEPQALDAALSQQFQFQPISAAEAALFMSHRQCWQKLLDSDAPMAAIFEDDAVLAPELGAFLQALSQSRTQFDLIKLETTGRDVVCDTAPALTMEGRTCHRLHTWHGGSAAYVVQRDAAKTLLTRTQKLADPVDQVLFQPFSQVMAGLCILQAVSALAIQHDILFPGIEDSAMATTISRRKARFRLFRHGMWTDLRRAWIKHRERQRRRRMAKRPGTTSGPVPFQTSRGRSFP